jgi:HTH-type transcriptional regulator / antitoxin HipB
MQTLVNKNTLGYLLKDARKKRGLTQEEAGKTVGLNQTMISRVENGRHMLRVDTLFKLLAALDLELFIQPREDANDNAGGLEW